MKKGKFFQVILFISGLALSLITNLVTGDAEVGNWYESNKQLVLYAGIGLTLLSIILSYNSQSEEANVGKSGGISPFKFLSKIILSGIMNLAGGLFVGLMFFWIINLFNVTNEEALIIITTLVGGTIGTQFKYIYGNDVTGAITGAFIGFAASYYFPVDLTIEFLPSWLNKSPIIAAGTISGAIGLFTAIFETDYENRKKNEEKEELEKIEPQVEKYELAVAILKNKGFRVYSSDLVGSIMSMAENANALEKKKGGKSKDEMDLDETKKKLDSDPNVAILKTIYKWLFGNDKTKLPKPPYKVFNKEGEELQKFTSINALHHFATNL